MAESNIRTERLLLRAARMEDQDAFYEWFRNPDCMTYWSTRPHGSPEVTSLFLESMVNSSTNGVVDFAVCLLPSTTGTGASDDQNALVIGKAGLYDGKEVGFIFNKAYWGKGYAFEALSAIMQRYWSIHSQDEDVQVIKADVDPRNDASLGLLKKLGFEVVGSAERTFETHIGWCDSVYLEARRPL